MFDFLSYLLGYYVLNIKGLNVERFVAALNNQNIDIKDIRRSSFNNFCLKVNIISYKKLLSLASKMCYTVAVTRVTGVWSVCWYFKHHIAVLIALTACSVSLIAYNMFVFQIQIYGLSTLTQSEVLTFLKQQNITSGTLKNSVNAAQLQTELTNNFSEISLCSVSIYGSSLVVNIKEKLNVEEMGQFEPLISEFDGLITQINLISGTLKVKAGDAVKKGDILVEPYVLDSAGQKKPIIAKADIYATVYFSSTVIFDEYGLENVRTGNIAVTKAYSIFGLNWVYSSEPNNFELYQTQVHEVYTNSLIPIKQIITTVYELKQEVVYRSYEENRQSLEQQSEKEALAKVPQGVAEYTQQTLTNLVGSTYYITANIAAQMKIC